MSNKIPFAYKNNKMVDVAEVESGKACGCFCPSCEEPLQARKGEVLVYHFAHLPGSDRNCEFAPETALHKMAKQILWEEKQIVLPPLTLQETLFDNRGKPHKQKLEICSQSAIYFDSVVLEKAADKIRPDVTAEKDGKTIYIEIYVTNKLSNTKKKFIREENLPTIEVNLSKFLKENTFSKPILKELIINKVQNKTWIHHPNYLKSKLELTKKLAEQVKQSNEVLRKNSEYNSYAQQIRQNSNIHTVKNKAQIAAKTNTNRILRCEYCFNIFEVARKAEVKHVGCPKCKKEVSQRVIKYL